MIPFKLFLFLSLVFIFLSFDSLAQTNKQKDNRSFDESFQDRYDSLSNIQGQNRIESMTLNEIERRNNQYNYDQSYNRDSESNNVIIILFIGLGIFLLGAFSNIKKTSMIKLLSAITYRFSPSFKKDNFNRKVEELKNLRDLGIISQAVYDSRMEDILKESDL